MKVQYTIIFVVFIFYGCSNKLNNSKIVDIEKSCKAGDKISCQKVADIFKKRNKPGDLSKAAKWYTEGCYLEYGKSCTQLGLLFEKDTVFEKDIKKSIRLYEKACDIGYAEACTRLGIKHLLYKARITGYCLDQEAQEKISKYKIDEKLKSNLRQYYYDSNQHENINNTLKVFGKVATKIVVGYPIDVQRIVKLFLRQCTYLKHSSTHKKKIVELFNKGCFGNYKKGCYDLGMLYYKGFIAQRNNQKAMELFDIACKANQSKACGMLGFIYQKGRKVKANKQKAKKYLKKACVLGDKRACSRIK
ncbi:MAG: hypothetical protein DRG11_05155 [Epsilonproteobacteria bacterium]|nr:MAG: hypothetical protein DRG11_05155 [Campylobacterota bacterium]